MTHSRKQSSKPSFFLLSFLLVGLLGAPAVSWAQSAPRAPSSFRPQFYRAPQAAKITPTSRPRLAQAVKRPVLKAKRPRPTPRPSPPARVTVTLQGSYGALATGTVSIRRAGAVVASGNVPSEISVPAGSSVAVVVTASSLVDPPTITMSGVSLPTGGGAKTVPVTVQTGLIRAEATLDGRRIGGVAWLYRINPSTGAAETTSCGSIGVNGSAREISAGQYRVVLNSGGHTLAQTVNITAGSERFVRLED